MCDNWLVEQLIIVYSMWKIQDRPSKCAVFHVATHVDFRRISCITSANNVIVNNLHVMSGCTATAATQLNCRDMIQLATGNHGVWTPAPGSCFTGKFYLRLTQLKVENHASCSCRLFLRPRHWQQIVGNVSTTALVAIKMVNICYAIHNEIGSTIINGIIYFRSAPGLGVRWDRLDVSNQILPCIETKINVGPLYSSPCFLKGPVRTRGIDLYQGGGIRQDRWDHLPFYRGLEGRKLQGPGRSREDSRRVSWELPKQVTTYLILSW